jgi:DNA primase
VLPDGLDPCDLLSQPDGVSVFNTVLASAVDALDFKLNRLLERDPRPSVDVQRRILDAVLGIMAAAPALASQTSQVKQELIVTRLAHRLGLRQETVWARLGELKRERKTSGEGRAGSVSDRSESHDPPAGPRLEAEKQLLNLLLAYPEFVTQARESIVVEEVSHTGLKRMLAEMYAVQAAGLTPDMDILRERLSDRPDLYEAAEKRRYVGQHISEPEQNLIRILGWFARQKDQNEEKSLTARLKGGALDADEATELLRKLQARR